MSDQQATRESKLAEALRHCVEIFKSMAARGAYPQELLPWDSDGRESPIFMGKQGFQFALDALAAYDAREGERAEAVELAIKFHETYERLAPQFGYETRVDTKAFDPESPNGKLMTAVCAEILTSQPRPEQAAQGESVEWQPIETAIAAADNTKDEGWFGPALFAVKGEHGIVDGWFMWVGQCDDRDIWLGRTDNSGCFDTRKPTHWMPLPAAPQPAHGESRE